jgi:protein-disulfide isomerase
MGAFAALDHRFFAAQDSIGIKSWASFASDAGVRDTVSFLECMRNPTMDALVREDSLAARRLGVDGTPTFLIDSLMVPGNPGFEQLNTYVETVLRRR